MVEWYWDLVQDFPKEQEEGPHRLHFSVLVFSVVSDDQVPIRLHEAAMSVLDAGGPNYA